MSLYNSSKSLCLQHILRNTASLPAMINKFTEYPISPISLKSCPRLCFKKKKSMFDWKPLLNFLSNQAHTLSRG